MAEGRLAGKTEEQILQELRELVVRARVLASYPDAFVWNARKCAELLVTLRLKELGEPIPSRGGLETLMPNAQLSPLERSYFDLLQRHGNAGTHAQGRDFADELARPALYLMHLRQAVEAIVRKRWPTHARELVTELEKVDRAIGLGDAGGAIDWAKRVDDLTVALERLQLSLNEREAREPETAVDKNRLLEESRLRTEAEQRAKRLETVALEQNRIAGAVSRALQEAEQRKSSLEEAFAREEAARRAAETEVERLRAASSPVPVARSMEPTPGTDQRDRRRARNRTTALSLGAFAVGSVGTIAVALAFPTAFRSRHLSSMNGDAAAPAIPAAPTVEPVIPSSAPAPAISGPAPASAEASKTAPGVTALQVVGGNSSWSLKLPTPLLEDRHSEQRDEATTTEGLIVRLYACAEDKWQEHRDRDGRHVSYKDNLSFTLNGVEGPKLFVERCLVGMKGPHLCVRILHRTGQEKQAASLLTKLGNPLAE